MKPYQILLLFTVLGFLTSLSSLSAQVPEMINYQGRMAVDEINFNGQGSFKFALVDGGVDANSQALATVEVVNGFVVGISITEGGSGYTEIPTVTITGDGAGATATAIITGGSVFSVSVTNAGSGYTSEATSVTISAPSEDISYQTLWSNDGTSSAGGEPTNSVSLDVTQGLYSVLLGNDALTNMTPIPSTVFTNEDVRLRVWFDDGVNGFQQLTPDQRIAAVGYAMMAGDVPDGSIASAKIAEGAVTTSKISSGSVTADKISNSTITSDKLAPGTFTEGLASEGSVIATGEIRTDLEDKGFVQVGFSPEINSWIEVSESLAPEKRYQHTAVWTGTEMIIWGGRDASNLILNSGARYNPSTNTWNPISEIDAPVGRTYHTAVWTGAEMIIWGGRDGSDVILNSGARYDPSTNTWTPISSTNVPDAPRYAYTAVWTGEEMIIWGGRDSALNKLNTGARYNPTTNTWTPITTKNAPEARDLHTAVWTGTEMIIWGGYSSSGATLNSGGRYDLASGSWTQITLNDAPIARGTHTAVWTGTEMIIYGGLSGGSNSQYLSTGARYNPSGGNWITMSVENAPSGVIQNTAVWTGNEMITWGGTTGAETDEGARYDPNLDAWSPTSSTNAPGPRAYHSAIWTGQSMIIWGGRQSSDTYGDGRIYEPGTSLYFYMKP